MVEIPNLQMQRKVKSMQIFHKSVKIAKQGDRVGICLTNLDSKFIERGIACAPGSVPLLHSVVCLVKKIRFFRFPCKSGAKFHVSIGHETVVASATFFGSHELQLQLVASEHVKRGSSSEENEPSMDKLRSIDEAEFQIRKFSGESPNSPLPSSTNSINGISTLNATYLKLFPNIDFSLDSDYLYQEEMLSNDGLQYGREPLQWVILTFQQPVYCPIGSLIIGSRLDVDSRDITSANAHQCRLAFFGPIKASLSADGKDMEKLGIYIWKQKECEIWRLSDIRGPLCYEVIAWRLITEGGNIHNFIGMKVITESGIVGTIVGPYGAEGKSRSFTSFLFVSLNRYRLLLCLSLR
jgi:selenocysteine-specific elongation factor